MGYAEAGDVKNYAQANKVEIGKESYKIFGFTTQALFDSWVGELVDWASLEIDDYVGHDFARHPADDGDEEAAEVFDGLGTDMVLTGFPILSVSKVEFRSGTATYGAWVDLPIIAWIAYERFIRLDRNTPVGFKNVRITYAYGYDDTPGPIVRATCRIVTNILQGAIQRSTSPIIRVDTFMIQLAKEEAFTQEIKTSLDGYRRIPHRVGTT